ncbi:hypothetical protein AB0O07_07040 [Streptomyces sp. NPDC093085]|uniref:hypothetical protein n=1 Tax=Streptomyces sp. NPDC093085 TaxID=3155068 RepID=UPI003422351B
MTSSDMGKTPPSSGLPRTRKQHRAIRSDAERRRSGARRDFDRLEREGRRELRGLRRLGETAVIVGRSRLAELGVRGIAHLAGRLRSQRTGQ